FPKVPATVSRVEGEPHTWVIRTAVPEGLDISRPVNINLEYRWRNGGILTYEELEAVKGRGDPGPFRRDNLEFAVIKAPVPLAFLELCVTLPQEYAQVAPEIRVGDGLVPGAEVQELTRRVNEFGPGLFMLRIAHPKPGVDYAIAWKP